MEARRESAAYLSYGSPQKFPWTGFLDKRNKPDVLWVRTGLEFQLYVLREVLFLRQFPYLRNLLDDCNVYQVLAAIFSAQDLRFYVIESNRYVNVRIVFARIRVGLDVRPHHSWISRIHRHLADSYRNLGRGGSFLKGKLHLLRFVYVHFVGSIHNQLGRVRGLEAKRAFVGTLTISERRRRVWIFPAILVPISHVLTEHDQLGASNRLEFVQPLQGDIRRRTTGTALGGEQLNEHGSAVCTRGGRSDGFVFCLQAAPAGGGRHLQEQECTK